ncbi:MAG TPA: hypothetical protein VI795_01995 [Patescibacteria group bacterium]|nr:hypothetical protein [Patescibacteria group bacterium]
MAEIQLTKIRSIYGEIKGFLESLPQSINAGPYIIPKFNVDNYNSSVDNLSGVTNTDYSRFKIPDSEIRSMTNIRIVKSQMMGVIRKLEAEYGFNSESTFNTSPGIVIFNKNQNEMSLQINYTIDNLIEQGENKESKNKLSELKEELGKTDKNWEKIKSILIWIINFSKELFLKIIPIILEKKL